MRSTSRRRTGAHHRNDDIMTTAQRRTQQQQDLEAQHETNNPPTDVAGNRRLSRLLPTFHRPMLPAWLSLRNESQSTQRPTSSRSLDTEAAGLESPKTPYIIEEQELPSTRLHLPNLMRTWSIGSNGPPSRPLSGEATGTQAIPEVETEETPLVSDSRRPQRERERERTRAREDTRAATVAEPQRAVLARGHINTTSNFSRPRREMSERSRPARARFRGMDPAEQHLVNLIEDGRRRRNYHNHDHNHRRRGETGATQDSRTWRGTGTATPRDRNRRRGHCHHSHSSRNAQSTRTRSSRSSRHHRRGGGSRVLRPPPTSFLFCFPGISSKMMRSQVLRCFVSGLILILFLTVYLVLSITRNINSSEFTVLLILIILFITIIFCHGLVRLCILVVRSSRGFDIDVNNSSSSRGHHGGRDLSRHFGGGPGGYAIPRRPIRVLLARDEEAAGIESETTKINPPAYGLWRESVRVDPNRIYWARADDEPPLPRVPTTNDEEGRPEGLATARRPPSYVSDDGVAYVVEAQPRSTAPNADVPVATTAPAPAMYHPSEAGRAGQPAAW